MNKNEKKTGKAWVIEWLDYLDVYYRKDKNIKPWEWDFKKCYVAESKHDEYDKEKAITNFLKYKNKEFKNHENRFNLTGKMGGQADCDKEARYIYQALGWLDNQGDDVRGDAMNSYRTTFTAAITKNISDNKTYKGVCEEIGIVFEKDGRNTYLWDQLETLYKDENYLKFACVGENEKGFSLFAKLTHTIGNFMVLSGEMNCARNAKYNDYWDLTLAATGFLDEFFDRFGEAARNKHAWKAFIERYMLQPFVKDDEDYSVAELWQGHLENKGKPKNSEEIKQFLNHVSLSIQERGKHMMKNLCESLGETEYKFYKEELEGIGKTPKFANKLWMEELTRL